MLNIENAYPTWLKITSRTISFFCFELWFRHENIYWHSYSIFGEAFSDKIQIKQISEISDITLILIRIYIKYSRI